MTNIANQFIRPDALGAMGLLICYGLLGFPILEGMGLALSGLALAKVTFQSDRPFSIRWLIVFLACLQWIVAPWLAYKVDLQHFKYFMYVEAVDYFALAVPGTIALTCGLFLFQKKQEVKLQISAVARLKDLMKRYPWLPFAFIGFSLLASLATVILPSSLAFVTYLIANLRFSAVLLFLLSDRKDRYLWCGLVGAVAMIEAISTSLFHDVLLWSVFIAGVIAWRYAMPAKARILALVAFIFFGAVVQSVKWEYRDSVWRGDQSSSAIYFVDISLDKFDDLINGRMPLSTLVESTIIRLNQGWIISRILMFVPQFEPFASGSTVLLGLRAALVPRILDPQKATAGGRDSFIRFTGLPLSAGTSMGVSVLGEAYGNFGSIGGVIFMAIYGLAISLAINVFTRLSGKRPLLMVFLPNIFLYAVKAETDFTTVANFVVKSGVFHLLLVILIYSVLIHLPVRRRKPVSMTLPRASR